MSLTTLEDLENIAARKFEERADRWVRAIAERENVGFNDLRPYLVSLHYQADYQLEVVFIIPEHTPIKLFSDYRPTGGCWAQLENGKLVGVYDWYVFKTHNTDSDCFQGVDDLGHALLLARWAHKEDERAKWA